jgi:hypothetical protein
MLRFAPHLQAQNSYVCARWRAMACRGSLPVLQLQKAQQVWLSPPRAEP